MVVAGEAGVIVNVASILGERVAGGVAPYAISKAAVVQATKAMALELARHRIRVNALMPGYIVTDLNRAFLESEAGEKLRVRIPSRRFGELQDLDGPLLLLASDAGSAMSGAAVAVDGAQIAGSLAIQRSPSRHWRGASRTPPIGFKRIGASMCCESVRPAFCWPPLTPSTASTASWMRSPGRTSPSRACSPSAKMSR